MSPRSSPASVHHARVAAQFGPQARSYQTSAVHAEGHDLTYLTDAAQRGQPRSTLDLGCGGGHASFALAAARAGQVVAYDLSREMLAAVRGEAARRELPAIQTVCGVAERLPFLSASVDLVATRFSAHHWADLTAALHEIRRVLRPGGRALIIDTVAPANPEHDSFLQDIETLRDPSHIRDYTVGEWEIAIAAAGLRPRVLDRWRIRLAFQSWVERSATPRDRVCAIRTLQTEADPATQAAFAIEADGSFLLDTALIAAETTATA